MENSKKIINWCLKNKDSLKLSVVYYTGLQKFNSILNDIEVKICIDQITTTGRGTDTNEDFAFCKALSEAIEKIVIIKNNLDTTNGLAIHYDIQTAQQIATSELIERDAFLTHFFLKLKPKKISNFNHKILDDFNIKIDLYELCNTAKGFGSLAIATGVNASIPFGMISGSSFNESLDQSIEKSIIEVLRNVDDIIETKSVSQITEKEFSQLNNFSFHSHGSLARNIQYFEKFKTSLILENEFENKFNTSVPCEYIEIKLNFLPDNPPLICVKATSKQLQTLYLGPTNEKNINFERLKFITGKDIKFENLNLLHHPFD